MQKGETGATSFGTIFDQKSINNYSTTHQQNEKEVKSEKQLEKNMPPKDRKKEELPSQAQEALVAPGDTIRSKIELNNRRKLKR